MDKKTKVEIGLRVREKREAAKYSREQLGELCSLSPRFIANVEFGDATFSLDSLMCVSKVLSCSCDYLLFGDTVNRGVWNDTISRLESMDIHYQADVDKILRGLFDAVSKAERTCRLSAQTEDR